MANLDPSSLPALRRGSVLKYFPDTHILRVKLIDASAIKGGQSAPVDMPAPHALFYNNGLYIGTMPVEGTPVIVGLGREGQYFFVSFLAEDHLKVPQLTLGTLLLSSNSNTNISLDVKNNILLGTPVNNIHINTKSNYISTNFDSEYNFTDASRHINGVIKRDLVFNSNFSQNNKLEDDSYETFFKVIPMDPTSAVNSSVTSSSDYFKNPPFVEKREIIYEFKYDSDIDDDLNESKKYNLNNKGNDFTSGLSDNNSRRQTRSETLGLSAVYPNFLIETIKGTVVDIFGNILDLNRAPLLFGDKASLSSDKTNLDKSKAFLLIKELERKSLAYHFEINARKDFKKSTISDVINSSEDYSRLRSRFFLDIDKEGQFKLNVPASSEIGNVPLLTRYENYSSFAKNENGEIHPNSIITKDNDNIFDIYHDSFAPNSNIKLDASGTNGAPKDRITNEYIKHGMVYHDITGTCLVHQNNAFIKHETGEVEPLIVDSIKELKTIVSDKIITSGDNANAGGRSGSINFDGSIELNIGANTVDRQSMWLDTAGGIVTHLGRDIRGRSILASTDGEVYIQIGGFGITADSRFIKEDNNIIRGVLDLRILGKGGYCHMIRCDDNGVTIMTPGAMRIHSGGDMVIGSDKDVRIEAAQVIIQERPVLRGLPSI